MTRSMLEDAFGHHNWANLRLADACLALSAEQLDTNVPGTYGSIIETLRHTVGADSYYLYRLGGLEAPIEEDVEAGLTVAECRERAERHAELWPGVLAADPDPDKVIVVHRDDGSAFHAPKGIRLAQVIHHGTDHRSQVCTALTTLGIEPPEIDVWAYAVESGRASEVPATSA